jgi:gamma-glutamylcyclotransferase (GGCT)/AIG2-like uncharacterized protein YtfP
MPPESEMLFVYGTLRRGFPLHRHLHEAAVEFIGEGSIPGRLYDLGEYPGAVAAASPGEEVHGELYRLSDPAQQLAALDQVEEYDAARPENSLFLRERVDVRASIGSVVKAWTYLLRDKPSNARWIEGGDYSTRTTSPGG